MCLFVGSLGAESFSAEDTGDAIRLEAVLPSVQYGPNRSQIQVGSAYAINDYVRKNVSGIVLIARQQFVPIDAAVACLADLAEPQRTRIVAPAVLPAYAGVPPDTRAVVAIDRQDWNELGGLKEYLTVGFIDDLLRRAARSGKKYGVAGNWSTREEVGEYELAFGLFLTALLTPGRLARARARHIAFKAVRNIETSPGATRAAWRDASDAVRDIGSVEKETIVRDHHGSS